MFFALALLAPCHAIMTESYDDNNNTTPTGQRGCCKKKKVKKFCGICAQCISVSDNLTVGEDLTVGGTITASGPLVANKGETITGPLVVNGIVYSNLSALATALAKTGIVPTGAAGYAMFYGLTTGTGNGGPNDYASTVAVKTSAGTGRVPFPRSGPATAGGIARVDSSSFTLPAIGTYEVTFRVHTTEPGQLELELNGVELPQTVAVNMNPTSGGHPIIGNAYITTTSINSVLAVINPPGNASALTITPADGSDTHANAQSITIRQIG